MLNFRSKDDFKKFIIEWNNLYPWDYQWRKKYNVSFGSPKHLEMDFISMKFDLREDIIYKNAAIQKLNMDKLSKKDDKLIKRKRQVLSSKEIDSDFDDLNIEDLDDTIIL